MTKPTKADKAAQDEAALRQADTSTAAGAYETAEPVEVIAVNTGFYDGALRQPGEKFVFAPAEYEDGSVEDLPTWVKRADGKAIVRKSKRTTETPVVKIELGDTKPAAAVKASAAKQAQINAGGDTAVIQSSAPERQTEDDVAGLTNKIGKDGLPQVSDTKLLPPDAKAASADYS